MAPTISHAIADRPDAHFECVVRGRVRALGWNCEDIAAAGSFSTDLVCMYQGEKLVIHRAPHADVDDVDHAIAARAYHSADHVLIVHTGGVAPDAQALADTSGIAIVSPDGLDEGCAYDRTEFGIRLRQDREEEYARQQHFKREAEARQILITYYRDVGAYQRKQADWEREVRRYPWMKRLGALSILPPMVLIGTVYFYVVMPIAIALGVYAIFFSKPGPEPIAPVAPEGITPQSVMPERRSAPPAGAKTAASVAFKANGRVDPRKPVVGAPTTPTAPAAFGKAKPTVQRGGGMSPVIVACPQCQSRLRLPRGKQLKVTCPQCSNKFRAET
jgi:hypothetical protein